MMNNGYEKLMKAVEKDCKKDGGTLHTDGCISCGAKCFHKYCNKFKWIIDRAKMYGDSLNLEWKDVLSGWEKDRNYWYMNYYQESNQPEIKEENVKVFENPEELREAIGEMKFRCPSCGREITDPYKCEKCGWKVYGLLGDLGKGVYVYVKSELRGENIFMPIAWENVPQFITKGSGIYLEHHKKKNASDWK